LDEFLLYNIVEGFLYQSKQSRVDKDTNAPLRPDLGRRSVGQSMVREYLRERYSQDYEQRLKQMASEERAQLCQEAIEGMLRAESVESYCKLLTDGVRRGEVTFKIENMLSYGCSELHEALLDLERDVLARAEKLQVFYTGENAECEPVWNSGNMYRTRLEPVKSVLGHLGRDDVLHHILDRFSSKRSHIYRGGNGECNRHGHSNDFPSYYAFGHASLLSFAGTVTDDAWQEYRLRHATCCGTCSFAEDAKCHIDKMAQKDATKAKKGGETASGAFEQRLLSLVEGLRCVVCES